MTPTNNTAIKSHRTFTILYERPVCHGDTCCHGCYTPTSTLSSLVHCNIVPWLRKQRKHREVEWADRWYIVMKGFRASWGVIWWWSISVNWTEGYKFERPFVLSLHYHHDPCWQRDRLSSDSDWKTYLEFPLPLLQSPSHLPVPSMDCQYVLIGLHLSQLNHTSRIVMIALYCRTKQYLALLNIDVITNPYRYNKNNNHCNSY